MEWTIETTHPRTECVTCDIMVEPAISTAIGWDSVAYGSQVTDEQGVDHLVVVRRVITEN